MSFNQGQKPIIKVFVILGPEHSGVTTTRKKNTDGEYVYSGYTYEVWENVHNKLKNQYDFRTTYSNEDDTNYDEFVLKCGRGEYDIVIGSFMYTQKRYKTVNYTMPINLDANSILHTTNQNVLSRLYSVFKK